jgi:hypothetical protein
MASANAGLARETGVAQPEARRVDKEGTRYQLPGGRYRSTARSDGRPPSASLLNCRLLTAISIQPRVV